MSDADPLAELLMTSGQLALRIAANPSVVAALVRAVHAYQRVVVTDASGEPYYVTANGVPQEIPASLRRPLAAALSALDEALR